MTTFLHFVFRLRAGAFLAATLLPAFADPAYDAADPDGDGRVNAVELLRGTDPNAADLPPGDGTFAHPGGLHTPADLERMKAKVAAGEQPWLAGWNQLLADPDARNTYTAAPNANLGVSRQRASRDAHAAYLNTIRWYVSGDTSYADCAVAICNAWSAAVNQVPTGTDIPGLSGIPIAEFAQVGEVLRLYPGWAPADFARFKTMMRTYLYPVCHDFLVRHNNTCDTHYWANWDLCNMSALLSIGVLCDDQAIFEEALTYFTIGVGNGNIHRVVATVHPDGLGQWQESGRDQQHAQLGVGLLGAMCEVAWNQGVDLYGYAGNRLLAGAEYVARSNLSRPVPYTPYDNCDHVNQYYLSTNGLGRIDDRPLWEMIYNHYTGRLGLPAPNVKAMAELTRPEHGSADHFGYGTLTFTRDAALSPYPVAAVPPPLTGLVADAGVGRVTLRWTPPAGDTAQGCQVRRATTAGGPYATVASWNANTYPEFTDTGVTDGTNYFYVVSPLNQAGVGPASDEVAATPVAAGALPDGWGRRDLGAVAAAGGAQFAAASGGSFVVTGHGTTIGGTADATGFAYRTAVGDCTIVARLLVNPTKGALLMRESFDAGAPTAALTLGDTGGREARFGTRATSGGNMAHLTGNAYTWTPVWFRLQRVGDTFTAAQSSDGVTWFTIDSSTVPMAATYRVGFAACGGTATFDHATVTGAFLAGPPGNLHAVNGAGQVTLAWEPAAGATGYNVLRSAVAGGPYALLAGGVAATSYVDTGLVDGATYYYVVTAQQDGFESAPSNEAIGVAGGITRTWSTAPTNGNWNVPANWAEGIVPGAGEFAAFGASNTTTLTNDVAGLTLGRVTFNAAAGAYTLGGATLGLAGDVVNLSAATQTLTLPLALDGPGTFNASAGPIVISGAIGETVAGSGVTKSGAQTLTLTGLNTFTGDVTHATGTLALGGVGTGTSGAPTAGALGRGTLRLGGGLLTSAAATTVFNNVEALAGTASALSSATANLTLAGNLTGSGNLNESGANVGGTHFAGNNAGFSGTFTSGNATNHRVRFNSAGSGSAAATWVLNNAQTDGNGLNFGTGTIHFGALSGGGQFRNDAALNTTATLSIGALGKTTTFTGVMVANSTRFIAVTKVGAGTLTFTGNHTFNGPTSVAAGTLLVNGAYASAVTVNGGAFGGTGTSSAAVVAGPAGTLAPGNNGVGTFTTTAALALQGGATLAVQLNSTTGTADKIVAGSVVLDGATLNLAELGAGALALGTAFTIVDQTGAGAPAAGFSALPAGALLEVGANTFSISYTGGTGNDVVLTVVSPPLQEHETAAPQLTLDGANARVRVLASVGGHLYQVQVTDDLAAGPWVNVGAPQIGNGADLEFVFPYDFAAPRQFFRVEVAR